MPYLKKFYDRYLLAAIGLMAAVSLVVISLASSASRQDAAPPLPAKGGVPFTLDQATETLRSDRAALADRRDWRESENGASPFISRVYLLKEGRLVDILESDNDLFPGIPNTWIVEHNLDYLDPSLPQRDPDDDGFTNAEEFTAKTNPRDAASRPEVWTKLRLVNFKNEQLQTIFTGRDVKGKRAMINSVAATSDKLKGKTIGPTRAYAIGEVIIVVKYRPGYSVTYDEERTPFRLKGFRTEERENPRITGADGKPQIDKIVFAILESTSGDGTVVELEARKPKTSPYSLATLMDTRPGGKKMTVRAGGTITLDGEARYKLVDVSEAGAKIENLATKELHSVPKEAPVGSEPTRPGSEKAQ